MNIRLKLSKTILLFVMLFCVMITFGFVSMKASAMECSEDNLVEPSQDDEHIHSYTYLPKGGKHLKSCSCGIREYEVHIIASADCNKEYAECTVCGGRVNLKTDIYWIVLGPESTALSMLSDEADLGTYSQDATTHKHSYSFKRISYKHHQLTCECGAVKGGGIPHMISSSDLGKRYAECIDCHDMLDMNTDMALVGGETIVTEEPHTHKYIAYVSLGISQHKGYCECGQTVTGNHKFAQIPTGKKCLQCDYEIEFQTGILGQ